MSRPAAIGIKALGILVLVAGFLLSSQEVHWYRDNRPAEQLRAEALRVDPTFLKIITGEFKGLMADYLNLKVAVFKGGANRVTDEDWLAMATLFKQSIVLDPLFFHTAYYTQGLLAWRKRFHRKAIDILTIHADHRYWDWEPKFYLGFDYFYFLKDDASGARYMRESAKLEGAPPLVPRLAARLMQRSGHTLTAIAFLKSMLEKAKDKKIKENLAKRLKAHLGVYRLEQARDAYQKKVGHLPPSLEELVEKGFIDQIPENTMAETFYYDPQTGEIGFDKASMR
jgi:hypothetical protein